MQEALIQEILDKRIPHVSHQEAIITLFEKVRDIPYGTIGSRNPEEVYAQNKGTCSGKHALLKELYREIGVPVKDCVVIHRFKNLPVVFPQEINEILTSEDILDPHNLLKIFVHDQWIIVDCTWDAPMKALGFPVNENRDGVSDQHLCIVPEGEIMEVEDAIEYKEKFLAGLSENQRVKRKEFLEKFTQWIDGRRK